VIAHLAAAGFTGAARSREGAPPRSPTLLAPTWQKSHSIRQVFRGRKEARLIRWGDFDVNVADLPDLTGNFGHDLASISKGDGTPAIASTSPVTVCLLLTLSTASLIRRRMRK
jgi:hypothetical protein